MREPASCGFPNNTLGGATFLFGNAPFVVGPQVPPPFGRGNERVFAFVRHDSRLGEFLSNKAVEAFSRSHGLGRESAVQRGFDAQNELAAEFLGVAGVRQRHAVLVKQVNLFFHDAA